MSNYDLKWVTPQLAVGYAPMSYADLNSIRQEGISAIVNLCGEFCDLHEIEEKAGFEVYYLPILDEQAPDMEEMEKALAWLDEAIYLGKKILIHCRYGIGRTGTFVTSYLLRRGLGLKLASKKLKHTRAVPTHYNQWKFLKKYSKKSGILKIREPLLERAHTVDLSPYFAQYEVLVRKLDKVIEKAESRHSQEIRCGQETDACCYQYFELSLVEAIYLHNMMNRILESSTRAVVIRIASEICRTTKEIKNRLGIKENDSGIVEKTLLEAYSRKEILCPLNIGSGCSLFNHRPVHCRLHNVENDSIDIDQLNNALSKLAKDVLVAISGIFDENTQLSFTLAETVSGKFVQKYFYYLAAIES